MRGDRRVEVATGPGGLPRATAEASGSSAGDPRLARTGGESQRMPGRLPQSNDAVERRSRTSRANEARDVESMLSGEEARPMKRMRSLGWMRSGLVLAVPLAAVLAGGAVVAAEDQGE